MAGLEALLGPVGMGVSVAGQIFGAIKSAKANKANQQLLEKKQQENKAMYDKNANQSFLDTNVGKDAVKTANNDLQDERKHVAGTGAITGASDEATVAANSNVTKNYNEKLSRLAGVATQYQQNQEGMYRQTKDSLDNQQSNINAQKAENGANLMENASNLMGTAAMGIGGGAKNPYKGDPGTIGKTGNFAQIKSKLPTPQLDNTLKIRR